MNAIRLQIPADANHIDIVRVCLYGIASKLGFSYEEIEDMKVAVSEACNNAVLHGQLDKGRDVIDICFDPDEQGLAITINNKGPSFAMPDEINKAEPPLQNEVSELRVGGLGIYLMEALMDEVTVQATESGTEVRLRKFIAMQESQ